MTDKKKILIADDEKSMQFTLKEFFTDLGYDIVTASNGAEALKLIRDCDLAVMDINMPGKDGLQVLEEAKKSGAKTAVIMMTADSTLKNAIEAIKHGAYDYVTKPIELDELGVVAEKALEDARLRTEVSSLKERLIETLPAGPELIGKSKAIANVFKSIGKAAPKDVTVLITGESGTGKELVARLIHCNSPRLASPFIAVNSAAVPRELLESELFGHEKGAFTGAIESKKGKFELADKGTLFLDEIAEMDPALQAKLLRAVQENEFYRVGGKAPIKVDIRIIAATNKNLEKLVEEKKFRDDLYYRLNVVSIELPPLRERKSDVTFLAEHFLDKIAGETGLERKTLSKEAAEDLAHYPWPGNVRELENTLRRAVLLSPSRELSPADLMLPKKRQKAESLEEIIEIRLTPFVERTSGELKQNLYDTIMPFMERPLIKLVLKKTRFNQIKAAEMLGINRNTLRKKIKELKITRKDIKD